MKLICLALMLSFSSHTFSQQNNPYPSLAKQDYLKKSNHQESAAVFLTLAGSLTIGLSTVKIWGRNQISTQLLVAGIAEIGGSIILFITAGHNRRKAASVSFKNEKTMQVQNYSLVYRSVPSVNLKIDL